MDDDDFLFDEEALLREQEELEREHDMMNMYEDEEVPDGFDDSADTSKRIYVPANSGSSASGGLLGPQNVHRRDDYHPEGMDLETYEAAAAVRDSPAVNAFSKRVSSAGGAAGKKTRLTGELVPMVDYDDEYETSARTTGSKR